MSYQSVLNEVLNWLAKQKIEPPPEIKKKIVKKVSKYKTTQVSHRVFSEYKCIDCQVVFKDSRKVMDVVCPNGHIHLYQKL